MSSQIKVTNHVVQDPLRKFDFILATQQVKKFPIFVEPELL
jgi:hypothetical protein